LRIVAIDDHWPIPLQHLYICGEAYSDAQGWVEGALQTADLVLAKFGVEPPTALRMATTRAAKA
jgi:hypothetical protein